MTKKSRAGKNNVLSQRPKTFSSIPKKIQDELSNYISAPKIRKQLLTVLRFGTALTSTPPTTSWNPKSIQDWKDRAELVSRTFGGEVYRYLLDFKADAESWESFQQTETYSLLVKVSETINKIAKSYRSAKQELPAVMKNASKISDLFSK